MRVAVIGSGVSGIAAGKTLARLGHQVVFYDKGARAGGHWALAYPGVHLQNLAELYEFTDFPWPFKPDDYPPAEMILRYVEAAIAHYGLDVRLRHEVTALTPRGEGWTVSIATPEGARQDEVDAVVVAAGHYTQERGEITLVGRELFTGRVITEHEIGDLSLFDGKRVAVVGFGKVAVDMLAFALGRARELHHVFRQARWLLPRKIFGMPISRVATERMSSRYLPSWIYSDPKVRRMHQKQPKTAGQSDAVIGYVMKLGMGLRGLKYGFAGRRRLQAIDPGYPMGTQLRGTLAPDSYFPAVARGAIVPHGSALTGFTPDGLRLADGSAVPADVVVLALGYRRPAMPYLPEPVRSEFAADTDGTQLYRHVLHPHLGRLGFAGYNHSPLHISSSEISALWLDAVWTGALTLPSVEQMDTSRFKVRDWKRAHTQFEPTRAYWISGHFHNYLDVLLGELGLRSRRKKNPIAENIDHYTVKDYRTIIDEYVAQRGTPRESWPLDT